MKTIRVLCCCLLIFGIIAMSGCGSFEYLHSNDQIDVRPFNMREDRFCLAAIEDFPSDKYLGEVLTAEDAIMHAEKEWVTLYGDEVLNDKPYAVYYDAEMDVWFVRGSLPDGYKGIVARILIQKDDGKILAVWRG